MISVDNCYHTAKLVRIYTSQRRQWRAMNMLLESTMGSISTRTSCLLRPDKNKKLKCIIIKKLKLKYAHKDRGQWGEMVY